MVPSNKAFQDSVTSIFPAQSLPSLGHVLLWSNLDISHHITTTHPLQSDICSFDKTPFQIQRRPGANLECIHTEPQRCPQAKKGLLPFLQHEEFGTARNAPGFMPVIGSFKASFFNGLSFPVVCQSSVLLIIQCEGLEDFCFTSFNELNTYPIDEPVRCNSMHLIWQQQLLFSL